uniref:N-alpha-acetyltransferase 60 n=1 Tax=Salix viminalis TaxID=40686 RepID=A0A6N2KTU7_SALVM
MAKQNFSHHPTICYRPIQPCDLEILERIHADIFPIRYESEFFQSVVHERDIVSWAAVDRSQPDGHSDELIGFVTARIVLAKETEIGDLLRYDPSKPDQTLVYILTLGVVESYRNLGIARSLIRQVIKYASSVPACRAVYLHVISYNVPAIHLYKKMSFKCIRRLQDFYLINGQHYDSFLFVYYVNGGRSPCSPLELLIAVVSYMTSGLKSVAARIRKNEEKTAKWPKCKETQSLMSIQTKRNLTTECTGYECVVPTAFPCKQSSHKLEAGCVEANGIERQQILRMTSSLPTGPLLSLYFLLLFPACLAADKAVASITYHGGPLLTGDLNLTLIWYGQFGRVHKNVIRAFVESLHYNAGANFQPQVSSWWNVIESYQEVAGKGGSPINVRVVKQVADLKYSAGKVVTGEFIQNVLQKVNTGGDPSTIPVILTARDVKMQGLCFTKCSQHGMLGGAQPYIVVGNPESECPGSCAWPFQKPDKGPLSITLNPPNGNLGADAMVIAFARALAEAVTNPYKTGFYQDKSSKANKTVEAASACWGIFGSGAFDGYTGKVRVDPDTGGGFNGHGSRGSKFLIPAVWNPKTNSCWTLL